MKDALTQMAEIYGDTDNMAGGTEGALQTDNPGSISKVLTEEPEAAMVIEGDFVPASVETTLEPETGYNVFTFPAIDGSAPAVIGAGDYVVMFNGQPGRAGAGRVPDDPGGRRGVGDSGGFSSPNKNIDTSLYPDELIQTTAGALAEAENFRFDMSDLQPSAFGGTVGQGLFKLFTGLPGESGRHRRNHAADGGRRGEGVRLGVR